MKIYLIGALKNRGIIDIANKLQAAGFEAFADWITPGPEADTFLLDYAKQRGWSYKQALSSAIAKHMFQFDKDHIESADAVVLIMSAGKSAHMEFGYARGLGKPGFILFDSEPDRFDLMYQFATDVFFDIEDLIESLKALKAMSGTS